MRFTGQCTDWPGRVGLALWCQAVSYLGPFSCPECTFCAHSRYCIPVVRVQVGIQRTIKEFMSQQRAKTRVRRDNTGAVQSERCCSNFSPTTKRWVLDFPVTLTPIVEVRKLTRPADMIRRLFSALKTIDHLVLGSATGQCSKANFRTSFLSLWPFVPFVAWKLLRLAWHEALGSLEITCNAEALSVQRSCCLRRDQDAC